LGTTYLAKKNQPLLTHLSKHSYCHYRHAYWKIDTPIKSQWIFEKLHFATIGSKNTHPLFDFLN